MAAVGTTVYRTGDLAEASVISMHGLTPSFERSGRGDCVFVFTLSDDDDPEFFESLFEDLKASRCRVEPKRFSRELKHVRELMYDFLGMNVIRKDRRPPRR